MAGRGPGAWGLSIVWRTQPGPGVVQPLLKATGHEETSATEICVGGGRLGHEAQAHRCSAWRERRGGLHAAEEENMKAYIKIEDNNGKTLLKLSSINDKMECISGIITDPAAIMDHLEQYKNTTYQAIMVLIPLET